MAGWAVRVGWAGREAEAQWGEGERPVGDEKKNWAVAGPKGRMGWLAAGPIGLKVKEKFFFE
jgi:hypothetical protein